MSTSDQQRRLKSRLSGILSKYDARPDTNAVRFALASPRRDFRWEWSSPESIEQYFIASTTKLYVTTMIMQLRSERRGASTRLPPRTSIPL